MKIREKKFKVWRKSAQRFLDLPVGVYNSVRNSFGEDDLIFLDFTGQKDSEGREIFEGDLFLNGESLRVVEFARGNWNAVSLDGKCTVLLSFVAHINGNIVVGNIFQNKNLLPGNWQS